MKSTPTLLKYLAGLAVACGSEISAYAQSEENTILIDTASDARINSTGSAEGKTRTGRFKAQQFMTGDDGIVSSVTIHLETRTDGYRRKASGVLHVEVWDDNEGKPGSKVGFLGDVDIPSVKTESEGGSRLTFENPIVGLKPNSAHYVVLDYIDSKAFVRRCCGGGIDQKIERLESVSWAVAETFELGNDGYPAPLLHSEFDTIEDPIILDGIYSSPPMDAYTWKELPWRNRDLAGMMKVTESIDDLPSPEISSFQCSKDSASLTWKSLPFKTYTLESSASLDSDQWNEIEDGIESTGFETVFVDDDAERLAAKEVYYRIRMEGLGE